MSNKYANKAPRRRQRNKNGGRTYNPTKRRSVSSDPSKGTESDKVNWLLRRISNNAKAFFNRLAW